MFGEDNTAMHAAMLYNYLGIPEMSGTDFQAVARKQIEQHGAKLKSERVTEVAKTGDGFNVVAGNETLQSKFLILSEGKGPKLSRSLGLEPNANGGIETDVHGGTAVPGAYVVGRSARPGRSQAIISAGDGAAAALDILSREAGKDVCDWDMPPKS